MGLLEGIASVFSGGLTGLIGVAVQKIAEHKTEKLRAEVARDQRAHELELRRVDAAIMQQEWTQRTKLAEIESAGKEALADSQAFTASFELEPERYGDRVRPTPAQAWLLVILDFIRGSIRPGITLYLCALVTLIYLQTRALIGGGIAPEQAAGIAKEIISTVLYLSTTTICWWFGIRSSRRGA